MSKTNCKETFDHDLDSFSCVSVGVCVCVCVYVLKGETKKKNEIFDSKS